MTAGFATTGKRTEAPGRRGMQSDELRPVLLGALAAVVWIVLWWLMAPGGGVGLVARAALLLLPLAGIALAVMQARAIARLRAETAEMRAALADATKQAADRGKPAAAGPAASPKRAATEPVSAPVAFSSGRSRPPRREDPQAPLPFGSDADPAPELAPVDLIRALHFPETADDREGFRALNRALKDRNAAQVVQAAQDMLTLLSQDGLYMDDLIPDRAKPEHWRRFADGERGAQIGAVGGIRDERALALCGARMRDNTVFRDAAHHFLRRFDRMLAQVAPRIDDEALSILTETRSSRAFMLLGRSAGMFD